MFRSARAFIVFRFRCDDGDDDDDDGNNNNNTNNQQPRTKNQEPRTKNQQPTIIATATATATAKPTDERRVSAQVPYAIRNTHLGHM